MYGCGWVCICLRGCALREMQGEWGSDTATLLLSCGVKAVVSQHVVILHHSRRGNKTLV
jgi:hypothetical protein